MLIDEITKELSFRLAEITNQPLEKILSALTFSVKSDQSDYTLEVVKFSKSPVEDAKYYSELVKKIKVVESSFVNGPVLFIVIKKYEFTRKFLIEIYEQSYQFDLGKNQNVVLDYSSPNIAKIFHIGHLRSTIIGNFLKRLHDKFGYKTIGINYLGDWGKQFGLVCTSFLKYGSESELEKDSLKHLFDIYVKISNEAKKNKEIDEEARKFFKEMEEKKEENLKLWSKFRELSIKKYEEVYKLLNITFDYYSGESFFSEPAKEILEKNEHLLTTDEDGSKVINLGNEGNFLLLKNDGSTLYSTRDAAAAFYRKNEFNPAKMLYIVASEQSPYFVQLKLALKKFGFDSEIIKHIDYGLVLGMSTRKGEVVFLEDVINKTKEVMKQKIIENNEKNKEKREEITNIDETALQLAISGLIIQDFSAKRHKDYTFNMDRCTNITGETGPYLQYTHCRLYNIQLKNSHITFSDDPESNNFYKSIIPEENDSFDKLVFLLGQYHKYLLISLENYEPIRLVNFLMKVCKMVNNLIIHLKVKGTEEELAKGRLLLFNCARKILADGMTVLGITPIFKM